MSSPKISAILPTYNRSAYLPRMIESVLAQDFCDFELILIDNGSTDGVTKGMIEGFAQRDERFRPLFLPENNGPAPARNEGMCRARADYIIHLDDDDYCERNFLSSLYGLITEYGADIAVTGCVDEIDGTVVPKYDYPEVYVWNKEEAVSEFLKREKFHTAPATKLYRKSVFDGVAYVPGMQIDDIHVTYRLFVNASRTVAQGLPTYRFVKHGKNTTSFLETKQVWPSLLEEYFQMQKERVALITERVPAVAAQARYAAWSYMISMVERIEMGYGERCEAQLAYMVDVLRKNKQEFLSSPYVTQRERNLMNQYVLTEEGCL